MHRKPKRGSLPFSCTAPQTQTSDGKTISWWGGTAHLFPKSTDLFPFYCAFYIHFEMQMCLQGFTNFPFAVLPSSWLITITNAAFVFINLDDIVETRSLQPQATYAVGWFLNGILYVLNGSGTIFLSYETTPKSFMGHRIHCQISSELGSGTQC